MAYESAQENSCVAVYENRAGLAGVNNGFVDVEVFELKDNLAAPVAAGNLPTNNAVFYGLLNDYTLEWQYTAPDTRELQIAFDYTMSSASANLVLVSLSVALIPEGGAPTVPYSVLGSVGLASDTLLRQERPTAWRVTPNARGDVVRGRIQRASNPPDNHPGVVRVLTVQVGPA